MKKILETTQLKFEKSSFLVQIIKHENGKNYVELNQTIHENPEILNSIKINPLILIEVIGVLEKYQKKLFEKVDKPKVKIPEEIQVKIQNRYLKGIPIKDLKLQFGYKKDLIETMLKSRGIEIVSDEIPKTNKRKKRYRKRW